MIKTLSVALLSYGMFLMQPTQVYICRSGTSYAYHTRMCRGLAKCTHRIDTVTVKEAIASGHSKMCGFCAR